MKTKQLSFREVSKNEFYNFIQSYSKILDSRTVTIGEPASVVYYEKFNKNKVVARVQLNEDDSRSTTLNEYEIIGG